MTLHHTKDDLVEFECDNCQEILSTQKIDFHDALDVLRTEGWTALPSTSEGKRTHWGHRCPDCRFRGSRQ